MLPPDEIPRVGSLGLLLFCWGGLYAGGGLIVEGGLFV